MTLFKQFLIAFFVLTTLLLSATCLQAQQQRFPATVTPVLNPPYSLFLTDYTDPGRNQLSANLLFSDFNEPSWTFKLRLTIESSTLRLRTIEGFTPMAPITAQPGVPVQLSATEWVEYLNFNHLEASGSGLATLQSVGRLPEGLYSFCMEVLDYATGDPLSRQSCTNAWLQLNDPPRILSPTCGKVVDPALSAFPFQWQLFNTRSPNAVAGTEYQLTLWELTDPGADPMMAVPNGQALQVYQSLFSTDATLVYGPAEPALELGKRYVYRVQARGVDGRDSFKNEGYSEYCSFSYGWPEGGTIELEWPKEDGGFRSEQMPVISWGSPDNLMPGQAVSYSVEVTQIRDGQTGKEALSQNPP